MIDGSLDSNSVRSVLHMWRETTDLKKPMATEFALHFMKRRGDLLEGFVKTAVAMKVMLGCFRPKDDASRAQAEALKGDLDAFRQWAEDGLAELAKLSKEG
jgi:hypothetical protein